MDEPDLETEVNILRNNLGAKTGESILVVSDTETSDIGERLFRGAQRIGLEAGLLLIAPLNRSGVEPPSFVTEAMKDVDIVVCPLTKSLTHTRAREAATENGARVATMPGITEQMMTSGAMTADYSEIERLSAKLATHLTSAETARIESEAGTLTMDLGDRDGISSDGIISEPGEFGNLPSGEAYIAPLESTATGVVRFNSGIAGSVSNEDPLTVHIDQGEVTEVTGKSASEFLEETSGDACARKVAELGLGTNHSAMLTGNILEDEKIYGTAHVAFGDNHGFGGRIECDSHLDGVVTSPSVYLDDELVVDGGEVVV